MNNRFLLVIVILLYGICPSFSYAQQGLCKGSLGKNIFTRGDFGRGTDNILRTDPGIAPGYQYSASPPPDDGLYVITNGNSTWGSFSASSWVKTKDRSNDPNGYFMVVNASFQPGLFYRDTVTVCGNTTYQFSADIINLMLPQFTTYIKPNLSFLVDGKEVYSSGDVPQDASWRTYGFSFTTPPDAKKIVLSLRNNAPGGLGNDIGLDNISFFPCGPVIKMPDTSYICTSDLFKLNPTIEINDPNALAFQWQYSNDKGQTWIPIAGANKPNVDVKNPREGQNFRLAAAASVAQIDNPSCNYFSYATVLATIRSNTPKVVIICPGGSVTLNGQVYRDSGYYDIVLKTKQGCDSIVPHRIIIEDLSNFRIQGDSIICPENFSILKAGAFAKYQWSTGATTDTISIETPGIFSVSVTSFHGCPASHRLTVRARELMGTVDGSDPNCAKGRDGVIRFTNISGVNRPLSYTLNGKDFQSEALFTNLAAGTYLATVQASPACKLTRSIILNDPPSFELVNFNKLVIKQFDSVQLIPTANEPIKSIKWSPTEALSCNDCIMPFAQPIRNTKYSLQATSIRGCVDSIQINFEVIPRHNTFAPNAFSPNDDGSNDYFSLYCDRGVAKIVLLSIFDRWGNELFRVQNARPNSLETRWNGLVRGQAAIQGLYIWRANLEFVDGETAKRSGEILLMY